MRVGGCVVEGVVDLVVVAAAVVAVSSSTAGDPSSRIVLAPPINSD
jgi:hypothetical protein